MHCQSNPIINTNLETKTFKNITLENKTLSKRDISRVPVIPKMEVLATVVMSKKLLTKIERSSITDVAGLLDTPSKIKSPKYTDPNMTKQKNNAIRESLIVISFSV